MKTKIVNELMKKLAIPIVGGNSDMQEGYRFGILVAISVIEKDTKRFSDKSKKVTKSIKPSNIEGYLLKD